jgi:hypothetical protein
MTDDTMAIAHMEGIMARAKYRHTGIIIDPTARATEAVALAMKEFPGICSYGLAAGHSPEAYEIPWDGTEIELSIEFLLTCKKIKTPTYSSYYMKHVVENTVHRYIGNGEFIVACIALGFTVIPMGGWGGSPNARIGISKRDTRLHNQGQRELRH